MPKLQAELFVRHATFDEVEKAIQDTFNEVSRGDYDDELVSIVKSALNSSEPVELSTEQGLSTEDWLKLLIEYGPLVSAIGESIWKIIVVPKLKKVFHEDRVSERDPNQNNE